jgi:hypothetical protein
VEPDTITFNAAISACEKGGGQSCAQIYVNCQTSLPLLALLACAVLLEAEQRTEYGAGGCEQIS